MYIEIDVLNHFAFEHSSWFLAFYCFTYEKPSVLIGIIFWSKEFQELMKVEIALD